MLHHFHMFLLLSIFVWGFESELIFCVLVCFWPAYFVGSPRSLLFGRLIGGYQCTLGLGVCSWFWIGVDSNFGCVPFVVFCYCFVFIMSISLLTTPYFIFHLDSCGSSGTVWRELLYFTWNWVLTNPIIGLQYMYFGQKHFSE